MKKTNWFYALVSAVLLASVVLAPGCGRDVPKARSVSGVEVAKVGHLETDTQGHTIEQRNLIDRLKADNDLGAVKHLYVISAYSGQVILYSPVRGKVTSGGKSLTPKNISGGVTAGGTSTLPTVKVGDQTYQVSQLPNEDGTYGSGSSDYLFWFSPSGQYHQHYLSGGQIIHVSDTPIATKGVIINIEK